jgi:hypothetical protein
MLVPDGAQFTVYSYDDEGYQVSTLPPGRSDLELTVDVPSEIQINDDPGFVADTIRIDFRKETFDRGRNTQFDPPESVIIRAINNFLTRLRYVTGGFQVDHIPFPQASWRLAYLNDDGSELTEDKELVRARGGRQLRLSFVAVNPDVWESMHSLDLGWTPPPWSNLLLNATAALPTVGTAVVLAATALEVFVAQVLDQLAEGSTFPPALWTWLNNRGDWQKDPSTDEQFDVLLRHFVGHSLKEEPSLWEAFKNLRTSRNTFVHEGVAKVGGKELSTAAATQLLARCREIVDQVRKWLPIDRQWAEFKHDLKVKVEMKML